MPQALGPHNCSRGNECDYLEEPVLLPNPPLPRHMRLLRQAYTHWHSCLIACRRMQQYQLLDTEEVALSLGVLRDDLARWVASCVPRALAGSGLQLCDAGRTWLTRYFPCALLLSGRLASQPGISPNSLPSSPHAPRCCPPPSARSYQSAAEALCQLSQALQSHLVGLQLDAGVARTNKEALAALHAVQKEQQAQAAKGAQALSGVLALGALVAAVAAAPVAAGWAVAGEWQGGRGCGRKTSQRMQHAQLSRRCWLLALFHRIVPALPRAVHPAHKRRAHCVALRQVRWRQLWAARSRSSRAVPARRRRARAGSRRSCWRACWGWPRRWRAPRAGGWAVFLIPHPLFLHHPRI